MFFSIRNIYLALSFLAFLTEFLAIALYQLSSSQRHASCIVQWTTQRQLLTCTLIMSISESNIQIVISDSEMRIIYHHIFLSRNPRGSRVFCGCTYVFVLLKLLNAMESSFKQLLRRLRSCLSTFKCLPIYVFRI